MGIHRGHKRAMSGESRALYCQIVSGGTSLAKAAVEVGCSLSTIDRERRREPKFEEHLSLARGVGRRRREAMQEVRLGCSEESSLLMTLRTLHQHFNRWAQEGSEPTH